MNLQQINYALAKQVPDLSQRGCSIETTYGAIEVPPGVLAKRIAALLKRELTRELEKAEKAKLAEELREERRELVRMLRLEEAVS